MRRFADNLLVPLALAGFLAAGWGLERMDAFQKAGERLRDPSVPTAMLNRGSLGRVLRHLRLVRPVPNDGTRHSKSAYSKAALDASLFQKKRWVGGSLYVANPDWVEDLAGLPPLEIPEVSPALFRDGWPLIALQVAESDLTGSKWGVLHHFREHGREWERPAALSVYLDGHPVFSSLVGLRMHGGNSREPGKAHSYRLYFREEFGETEFPREWFSGSPSRKIRRFVVRANWPAQHPFAGLLALDMAERLGCTVPRAQPVVLVLNGQPQTNVYHLSEHVGRSAWADRIGHKDFLMAIYKGRSEEAAEKAYGEWSHRIVWEPLDPAGLEREVDLDNLCAYVFAVAYAGVTDGFQGAAIKNLRDEHPRWAWINWDMDHGFWDVYGDPAQRPPWQQESWELVFKRKNDRNYAYWRRYGDVRAILFARLMDEVPAFRERFLRFATDSLNHRIDGRFLETRIAHYEQLARALGQTDLASIDEYRDFVRHRPAVVREGLQRLFAAGAIRRVEVCVPEGTALRIDGVEQVGPYAGDYFDGQAIELEWLGPAPNGFRGWMVNGLLADTGRRFACAATTDMQIKPMAEPVPPPPAGR